MLPGIMGSLQANEAIKILSGYGIPLEGELLIFDAWRTETRRVRIPKDPDHPRIEGLIDHEAFCGLKGPQPSSNGRIPTISPEELRRIMKHGNVTLVDVREPGEKEIVDIGGQNIPLNELEERMGELEEDARIVLYCRSGQRSARGVQILQEHWPNARLQNLEGGVLAWIDRIDRSLPSY